MKNKIAALYIIAVIAIIALPAQAAVVVTNITHDQFDDFFSYQDSRTVTGSTAVWYAQIQAGGTSHEIEVGGTGTATDTGETSWTDEVNNPFSLVVDSANYLKLTFNGVTAGDGYQVPIGQPFNEIWVELKLGTAFTQDILATNSQVVDGPANLPSMSLTGPSPGTGVIKYDGFKFYFDNRLANAGQFSFNGNLAPNMFFDNSSFGEQWTYTFVGVYNTALVPEPSTIGLIIASMFVVVMLCRRKQSSYPPVG